ncbi:uncharacterized protein [Musca autumnalis]|uniref:uncharacterized protein n=1 Tax=Musca autumnalis TaxID=221902 RepID=UPI003CE7A92D
MLWIGNSLEGLAPKTSKCIGKHNMPLDEKSVQIKKKNFKPFQFVNLDAIPISAEMLNFEGILFIQFEYSQHERLIMCAGPREEYGNYSLEIMLWRWMEKSQPENYFGDIQFPAELHLFFINENNPYSELTALSFPLKVVKNSQMKFFDVITQHLPLIRSPSSGIVLPPDSIPLLGEILNTTDLSHFYTYSGRSCYVVYLSDVIWFDMISPIEVGIDFVQQVEYLETFGDKPLMEVIVKQKPPAGIVTKSFGTNKGQKWFLAPEVFTIAGIILFYHQN